MKIKLLSAGVDVSGLAAALAANEHLWNEHPARTSHPASPHYELDDIWARYAAPTEPDPQAPHDSVWYPSADVLGIKPLVYQLMHFVNGDVLGGVLITRIKAGQECKPHIDPGWHARRYQKFAIQIQSAPGQAFCVGDQQLDTKPGDIYWFDNSHTHWVPNPTAHDRITLIACIKTEMKVE